MRGESFKIASSWVTIETTDRSVSHKFDHLQYAGVDHDKLWPFGYSLDVRKLIPMKIKMKADGQRFGEFRGLWVALDNCRYDSLTHQPIEGDVVDADEDLADLCARMRELGQTSCSIVFCDDDVVVEPPRASSSTSLLHSLER